tara:strand:+ start:24351 stop:24749 length:399 start_codon:yes stop_codon:yes gene_type:complete
MDFKRRNNVDVNPGMSSMTDLVFLMLIFFILLATQVSTGLNVNLPKAQGSVGGSSQVTVGIDPESNFFIGNEPVAREELEVKLQALLADKDPDKKMIILKADEMAPTGATIGVVGMAKVNEWKIMVQTKNAK